MTNHEYQLLLDHLNYTNQVLGMKRKLRSDLTWEELERLEKYGSLEFKSAGAKRVSK